MTRICIRPECNNPLIKRKGEAKGHFGRRQHCCQACSQKTRNEKAAGNGRQMQIRDDTGTHPAWLARPSARLLVQLDQLPPAEQQRALAGWGT